MSVKIGKLVKTTGPAQVFDDVFNTQEQQHIEDIVRQLPWFINNNTVGYENNFEKDDRTIDAMQCVHKFFPGDSGGPNSDFMETIREWVDIFGERTDNLYNECLRAKANFQPRWCEGPDVYNPPYIDCKRPHHVFLYYANESDGDTFIFDRRYGEEMEGNQYNVIQRISPKRGRWVVFDGHYYHAGSHPRKYDKRLVLNFDVIKWQYEYPPMPPDMLDANML